MDHALSPSPSYASSQEAGSSSSQLHSTPNQSRNANSSAAVGGSSGARKKRTRKKVAKACLACQKSHLTCDAQRPCTRCVKKGLGEQCIEGVRKKAKYLLEGEERGASSQEPTKTASPVAPTFSPFQSVSIPPSSFQPNRPSISTSYDPTALDPRPPSPTDRFAPPRSASSLASNRFDPPATTSTIPRFDTFDPPQSTTSASQHVPDNIWLPGPSGDDDGLDPGRFWTGLGLGAGNGLTAQPNDGGNGDMSGSAFPFGVSTAADEFQMLDALFGSVGSGSPAFQTFSERTPSVPDALHIDTGQVAPPQSTITQGAAGYSEPWDIKADVSDDLDLSQVVPFPTYKSNASQAQMMDATGQKMSNTSVRAVGDSPFAAQTTRTRAGLTASDIYRTVVRPYDYTEGYHVLMNYLTKNFEQKEILRVVHALASFRPSLIALQMPMIEDDEIFIERSFQRTLMELEKLISYSATPTAVWRRTGEVCIANPEFCQLVKKQENELVGKKSYIYHILDKPSVILYWEGFSVHAFENTTQNYFSPMTLKVEGALVACSCCFTIRRDVFDLPSVVIGQFLPIPGDAA